MWRRATCPISTNIHCRRDTPMTNAALACDALVVGSGAGGLSAAVITLLIAGAGSLALRQGGWAERFNAVLRRR